MSGGLLAGLLGAGVIGKTIFDHSDVIKRGAQYWDICRASGAHFNIQPSIMFALLWQESRFISTAKGAAGEIGIAQFLPIAYADLRKNNLVVLPDNPAPLARVQSYDDLVNDPESSIWGAAAFLWLNRTRFGNIYDSLRAYNAGSGNVSKSPTVGMNYMLSILKTAAIDFAYRTFDNGA